MTSPSYMEDNFRGICLGQISGASVEINLGFASRKAIDECFSKRVYYATDDIMVDMQSLPCSISSYPCVLEFSSVLIQSYCFTSEQAEEKW